MKIPKREMKKWINALRSGEYNQTQLALQDQKGFCCLGVACDLVSGYKRNSEGDLGGCFPDIGDGAPLWLSEINVDFHKRTKVTLSSLNDTQGFTFEEISDLLQAVYIEGALDEVSK